MDSVFHILTLAPLYPDKERRSLLLGLGKRIKRMMNRLRPLCSSDYTETSRGRNRCGVHHHVHCCFTLTLLRHHVPRSDRPSNCLCKVAPTKIVRITDGRRTTPTPTRPQQLQQQIYHRFMPLLNVSIATSHASKNYGVHRHHHRFLQKACLKRRSGRPLI